ncbi:hypothetical protein, partial [Arcobacter cloacae]
MNSFRVIDTRFRILKGGKIGLSLSISLIGSALVFGNINAYSQTFFDGITDGVTYTTDVISVTSKSDDGDTTANYSDNDPAESIVFKPQRVVSSYVGVADYEVSGFSPNQSSDLQGSIIGTSSITYNSIADGTYNNGGYSLTNYDIAYYQIYTPSTNFTVTLDTNSTVNNIIKDNSEYYRVNSSIGYNIQNTNYTANVVFTGVNRVYGSTNIGDGNIKLDGSVIFDGTVNAGSISVDTANPITFNSAVDLTAGTTDNMNFSTNGNVLLNSNFTGNITTTADNQGNVTILGDSSGKEQIITGNIGNSTSSDINTLNIGSGTNYSRTIINGDVFANSTVLNNTTTNSSTLILSNDKNITSTITTSHDNKGILTLSGGTQTVTGQVGTDALKLAEINAGVNGSDSTFNGDVFATNLDVEGTGIVNLNGDYTGTSIRYNADGRVVLADGSDVNSAITTATNNTGTLTLNGSSTVSGNVGASG